MLEITAYSKINLFLEITGKLSNGYHTVDTVMQSVSLADSVGLELTSKENGITLITDDIRIPTDERNIAYKAANKYIEAAGLECGVNIKLFKRIPSEAGMGGGSVDGAAVLAGLNKLSGNALTDEVLIEIASSIGADVPFGIKGGTQRLGGIGTDLVETLATPNLNLVIAKPMAGISTPAAYKYLDHLHGNFAEHVAVDSQALLNYVHNNSGQKIANFLYNRFEEASAVLCPETTELISFMKDNSYGALLSGSGAAVFAITDSDIHSYRLVEKIKDVFPDYYVTKAQTVPHGCLINN